MTDWSSFPEAPDGYYELHAPDGYHELYTVHFPVRFVEAVEYYQRDPFAQRVVDIKARETGRARMAVINDVTGDCISVPKRQVGAQLRFPSTTKARRGCQ